MSFDHVLLIGYGGPRKPEEVMPFLQKMTGGRNVSEEKLRAFAQNYDAIGGASPYNKEAERFSKQLREALQKGGINLPVFMGMKNWHPFLKEILSDIQRSGHKKGLAIVLNPFPGAVAGARYKEGLEDAQTSLAQPDLTYAFLEGWQDRDLFIEAQADHVSQVLQTVPPEERAKTSILFSFHSLPDRKKQTTTGLSYVEEAQAAGALVAKKIGHSKWSVVYQSKPLSAQGAWLGPDVGEAIERLAQDGAKKVIVVPLGFVCDQAEILYDLDIKAREVAEKSGIEYLRAKTIISHPKVLELFKGMIAEAIR